MYKCIVALFLFVALSSAVHVDKCVETFGPREGTYGSATLEDVRVSECEDPPCKLRKGADTTVEFDFIPEKDYDKVEAAVYGGIGIVRVPFREVHGMNACPDITKKSDGSVGCPLIAGEQYTYSNKFPILKTYPAVSVKVQYGISEGKNQVVCFSIPSKISN